MLLRGKLFKSKVKVADMGIAKIQLVAGMHGLEITLSPHVVDKYCTDISHLCSPSS